MRPLIRECFLQKLINVHYVKNVRIRSYSGPYSVQIRENTGQNNSKYGNFLRSGSQWNFARKLISVHNLIRASTLDILDLWKQ